MHKLSFGNLLIKADPPPQKNANGQNEYTSKIQAAETVGSRVCGLLSQDKSMYVYFSYLKPPTSGHTQQGPVAVQSGYPVRTHGPPSLALIYWCVTLG